MKKIPLYFSNNLEFIMKSGAGSCTDRAKLPSLIPAMMVGLLLVLLGAYEWAQVFRGGDIGIGDAPTYQPILSVWFFDLCFVLVGIGIITSNILTYLDYNKYQISSSAVTIIHRRLFGGKKIIKEKLSSYIGVRFRVEFLQSGIVTKNRYIIELYQKNNERMVPLYISTSNKKVRLKWKEYAKLFKLPAAIDTDEGLKLVDAKDLSKSLATLYKQGRIVDDYDDYERLPSSIRFVRKKDKIVIKIRKIVWDAYNIIAWFIVGITFLVMLVALRAIVLSGAGAPWILYMISTGALLLIIAMVFVLFRKEKLVLKRHKIVNTHKYMLFSTKHNQIMKKDIAEVEVTENPATGRWFVSIIADNNTITFAAKLPKKDLRWIKRFLIHEIVK